MENIRNIVMLEIPQPLAARRTVAFCEAIYHGEVEVEGIKGVLITELKELPHLWEEKQIGVMVDAILAKRNLGSTKQEGAPLVIGVGPGFTAPHAVDVVVESNRGHNLSRAIYKGSAESHTGIPGSTMGYSFERVLRSPRAGMVKSMSFKSEIE